MIDDPAAPIERTEYPPVVSTVAERLAADPDSVALEHAGVALTNEQLAAWAADVADRLTERGVVAGSRVAIVGRRGPAAVAAMLGVLSVGAVMVPIDVSGPAERRRLLMREAEVELGVWLDDDPDLETDGVPMLSIPGWAAEDLPARELQVARCSPDGPAYIFFTSGSTGTPKGVLGTHNGLAQFMTWMIDRFKIGPEDRVALSRTIGFDAVLREIFVPLMSGARIVIAPDPVDPDTAIDWIARRRITVLNATPSHAELWLTDRSPVESSLRMVFFSGEVVTRELVARWRAVLSPPGALVNLYGPTETTFIRTHHIIEDVLPDGPVAVGTPLPGTQLLVVDDDEGRCEPGEPGEVLIRTAYGTLGYVNSDGGFVTNPFGDLPDDLVYRTGDIGWIRDDGSLVVSGRRDDQVKVLGVRIEPGEIAAILERSPTVRRAAVLPMESDGRVRSLQAVIVPQGNIPDTATLRSFLRSEVPSVAIPARYVVVDELPLTANGKIDRVRLRAIAEADDAVTTPPEPAVEGSEDRLAALSPTKRALLERRLAADRTTGSAESERIERLSPAKRALLERMAARADAPAAASSPSQTSSAARPTKPDPTRPAHASPVPDARIARLSPEKRALLEARLAAPTTGAPVREAPLSPAQERLWFLDRMYPDRANYSIVKSHRLVGPLDVDVLERALGYIANRHEILRTRYVDRDGEPLQVIDPDPLPSLQIIDISDRDDAAQLDLVPEIVSRETRRRFDLEKGPIWRNTLIRIGPTEHVLINVLHHIASDGWSLPVLYRELSAAYAAFSAGEEPDLEPLPIQYADYAIRQRADIDQGAFDEDLAFWRHRLEGAPEIIDLPIDRPRPEVMTSSGNRVKVEFQSAGAEDFWLLAREETVTGFMLGLALLQTYLHRVTGDDDIVVGVPSADRSSVDTQPLIGFLVNTMAIRHRSVAGSTFRDVLRAVRSEALASYDHREVPFEHVVRELAPRRRPDRNPIFQVFYQFGLDAFTAAPEFEGVDATPIDRVGASSKFDFTIYMGGNKESLTATINYNTDLFDESTITRMLGEFDEFAGRVLRYPDEPLSEAGRRSESESHGAAAMPNGRTDDVDTDTVDWIRRVWSELLGREVGPSDDFFAHGGHSLLAIRMLSRLEAERGVRIPVRTIFESPTPLQLAAALDRAHVPDVVEVPTEPAERGPLSFPQRRLWFLHRLDPDAGNYHTPWRVRLRGDLDVDAIQHALDVIVERHAVFRTRIEDEGGVPYQVVDPPRPVPIEVIDAEVADDELSTMIGLESRAPFDLSTGHPIRVKLFRCAPRDHILSIVIHHIATDAETMAMVKNELAELYTARVEQRPPVLKEVACSYLEAATDQIARFSRSDDGLSWWLDRLSGELPVLDLPSDRLRPTGAPREAEIVRMTVDAGTVETLAALGRGEGATLFMTLMAGYAALLHRYTRQTDMVVGIPSTERDSLDLETVAGFFVNTLPIRLNPRPDMSAAELLAHVRIAVLDALEHRDVPFDAIVERLDLPRDPSRTPVFQTVFDMGANRVGRFSLPGLETVPLGVELVHRPAKFDIRTHAALRDGVVTIVVEYRSDLFDRGTVSDMAAQYVALLEHMAAEPDTRIGALNMSAPSSRSTDDQRRPAPGGSLLEALDRAIAMKPGRTAVLDAGKRHTYREIDAAARRISDRLTELGVQRGDTVGISMPRSADIVAATIGILRAGAIYVPLDIAYPQARIDAIAADARLAAVITRGDTIADPHIELLDRTADRPSLPDGTAYVMYTSGSTGKPKGVMVPESAIRNLVLDPDYVSLDTSDVVGFASNTGFDAATFEIWGALLNGATLSVLDADTVLSPDRLADAVASRDLTVMFLTTALFNAVVRGRPNAFASMRTLMFGGEASDPDSVRRCLDGGPPERLVHVYGPTETTTFATWKLVTEVPERTLTVSIGTALSGARTRVVDEHFDEVPLGVPGELLIGGNGVAAGYLGDPDLTETRFIDVDGDVEYRTGDLVRRRHDGEIEFLGRLDRQIKLRGFRIEPGEIEAHLRSHPRIEQAYLMTRRVGGGMRLDAYIVGGATPDEALEHLRGRVPAFMVPAAIVELERLPVTPNGKVDESALPEPTIQLDAYRPPEGPDQEKMAAIWARVLEVERVGATDDFFALGGHSLLAIQLVSAIQAEFGQSLPLSALFETPTLEALTGRVVSRTGYTSLPIVTIRKGVGPNPLFCMPPAGGNVMVYEPMARAFDGDQAIVGIEGVGVDGVSRPLRSIDAIADYCVKTMASAGEPGPHILVGYSMGGLVAFEVARRLERAGEDVGLVVLIDTHVISESAMRFDVRRQVALVRTHGRKGAVVVGKRVMHRARQVAGKLRHGPKTVFHRATGRPLNPRLSGRLMAQAATRAVAGFQPRPFSGRVLFLMAEDTSSRRKEATLAPWRAVASGDFEVVAVPGNHRGQESMMRPPYAEMVAKHISDALRADGRGKR